MSVARQYTTTRGKDPSDTAMTPRIVPAKSITSTRPAVPVSMLLLGIVAVLVAAWGAAAPFAAPNFGYVADRFGAWQWSVTSACLGLGPGALAFLASLVVVGAVIRTSYARRVDLWFLGLVVTLCGAWFVVGQYVWPVVYGDRFIAPSTANHFMYKELTFAIGPGAILIFCGAVFMGWAIRRQLAIVADRYPRTVVPSPGAGAPAPTVFPRAASSGNIGTMAPPPAADGTVADNTVADETVADNTLTHQTVAENPVAESPVAVMVEPPADTGVRTDAQNGSTSPTASP
jgi:hypothetical protein